MKRIVIITLLTIYFFSSNAQTTENRARRYAMEIQADSFLIYSYPCDGEGISTDSCNWYDGCYLWWVKDGNYFLKRFEYCHTYQTIPQTLLNPFHYYIIHEGIINKEKLRQPKGFTVEKHGKRSDTLMVLVDIDHACIHTFKGTLGKKDFQKEINTNFLDMAFIEKDVRNINDAYNKRTKLRVLVNITTSIIEKISTTKQFIEE